ncbi:hypothetical protein BBAD15_g1699 [Beauveria bassiana D1-5]|uniref:Aminoglycoside phosphotransferase domain-containing protein n=1 Tax=Beauveria bassiana D1-5 TaxID=1245745 RepID=A0A0A2W286_BEABA|nr:hypothetical protein BBAD15_g1699 [Beauveria bassiana D1-5]
MDAYLKAPFFAPEDQLPAPLPPPEVIASAGVVLQEYTGRRVVRFGESYIIKYGLNVSHTEGENMLFLKQNQMISVPEVYALYSKEDDKGNKVNYIIMEYIKGESLDVCWPLLDLCEKDQIASQLRRRNIVMRGDKTLVVIDWEAAGWYPEYWEYVLATITAASWKDDWHEYLAKILDEYPNEYAWFDMMIREIWS